MRIHHTLLLLLLAVLVASFLAGTNAFKKWNFHPPGEHHEDHDVDKSEVPCKFILRHGSVHKGINYTYDLCPLKRDRSKGDGDYVYTDEVSKHRFYFNVCNNTQYAHSCPSRHPAYILHNMKCASLGDLETQKVYWFDHLVPGAGISVTYSHGAKCKHGVRRKVQYRFHCDPNANSLPTKIREVEPCFYVVHWPSPHGCPLQEDGNPNRNAMDKNTRIINLN
eukprot:GEZU01023261.1.p2 GENE.GEZU01023261.1~~GEZU01023261.1.p2  ORF type:complete len:222 (-),score=30.58 GEZU01023261.1:137-802(-)